MICLSIGQWEFTRFGEIPPYVDLIEIRLDLNQYSPAQVEEICRLPIKKIFTCRPGHFTDKQRLNQLKVAIDNGTDFVDIEMEAEESFKKHIQAAACEKGCKLIASYHNFKQTPDRSVLISLIKDGYKSGADLVKIACQVHSFTDSGRILSLYGEDFSSMGRLVALGMGKMGLITRIAAPFLGAPFTFASMGKGLETSSGQLDWQTMDQILKQIKGGS